MVSIGLTYFSPKEVKVKVKQKIKFSLFRSCLEYFRIV